jgi:hypothetical protein
MRWIVVVPLLTVLIPGARAQDYVMPRIPTETEKIEALKLGYILNGSSMVRWGSSIDVSNLAGPSLPSSLLSPPQGVVRTIPITPAPSALKNRKDR